MSDSRDSTDHHEVHSVAPKGVENRLGVQIGRERLGHCDVCFTDAVAAPRFLRTNREKSRPR
jgi:hypothetical protein